VMMVAMLSDLDLKLRNATACLHLYL